MLERTAPELAADIINKGIISDRRRFAADGIDRLLTNETGLPVYIAEDPLTCVAKGTGFALNNIGVLSASSKKGLKKSSSSLRKGLRATKKRLLTNFRI